jgi:hypothetical protein
MSTLLELKMREAGVKLPSRMQRIWTWVRDNPQHTVAQIDAALQLNNRNNTSSLVSQLISRGMLFTVKVQGKGRYSRPQNVVSANPAMRGEYEILPMPKKTKSVMVPVEVQTAPDSTPAKVELVTDERTAELTAHAFVSTLPVRRAREIFDELSRLFSPKDV